MQDEIQKFEHNVRMGVGWPAKRGALDHFRHKYGFILRCAKMVKCVDAGQRLVPQWIRCDVKNFWI